VALEQRDVVPDADHGLDRLSDLLERLLRLGAEQGFVSVLNRAFRMVEGG
jgi:hypothetical protein